MELDVLAFAAHRDDIELTCAGTLIKMADYGYKTGIVDLTAGEMGTLGSAEIRAKEAARAAQIMNLNVRENLGLPDGNIQVTHENVVKIVTVIRQFRPKVIILPWEDRHPDHTNTGLLVAEAAYKSGLAKLDTGQPHYRSGRLLYYMAKYEFTPSFIVDVTEQFPRRMEAIKAFNSQVYDVNDPGKGKKAFVGSKEFLEMIEVRARYYGGLIDAKYGEPFFMRQMIEIEDIVRMKGGIFR